MTLTILLVSLSTLSCGTSHEDFDEGVAEAARVGRERSALATGSLIAGHLHNTARLSWTNVGGTSDTNVRAKVGRIVVDGNVVQERLSEVTVGPLTATAGSGKLNIGGGEGWGVLGLAGTKNEKGADAKSLEGDESLTFALTGGLADEAFTRVSVVLRGPKDTTLFYEASAHLDGNLVATLNGAAHTMPNHPNTETITLDFGGAFDEVVFAATQGRFSIRNPTFDVGVVELEPCASVLSFADPAVEAEVRSQIGVPTDDIFAADVVNVVNVDVNDRDVTSLAGLECLPALRELRARRGTIADLSPLTNLVELRFVDLEINDIVDIAPLAGLVNLGTLDLDFNDVADLTPLAGLTELTGLTVRNQVRGGPITTLAPLSDLRKLRTVNVDNQSVTSLAPLAAITTLQGVFASENPITDISPLTALSDLRVVRLLRNAGISDLSPLADKVLLQSVAIPNETPFGGIVDLSPLADKPDLFFIDLRNHSITDISPLANDFALRDVSLDRNPISDISALADKTLLRTAGFDLSPVDDISALGNKPSLRIVRLQPPTGQPNLLSDLSPLAGSPGLTFLDVRNQAIADFTPIAGVCSLDVLRVGGNPLVCPDSVLAGLAAPGCEVPVSGGCP